MLDLSRSGFDNLFLIAGYDWQAKMVCAGNHDWQAKVTSLEAEFNALDQADDRAVVAWENSVLFACGMDIKPLPEPKPAPVVEPVKHIEPDPELKVVPKTQSKPKSQK